MATDPITPAEIHAAELAALRDEVDQQRTRAEAAGAEALAEILARKAAEAELREALHAIDDLTKALDRERKLNAAQCREADRE